MAKMNPDYREKMHSLLSAATECNHALILLSNGFEDPLGKYEILAGFGSKKTYTSPAGMDAPGLKLGFISYDYKNRTEDLFSHHEAAVEVPDFFFFEPERFYCLDRNGEISGNFLPEAGKVPQQMQFSAEWKSPEQADYIRKVEQIREDIRNGLYYELNYCTQWTADGTEGFNPYAAFLRLCEVSPAPFSCFVKFEGRFLLCSSPERFLCRDKDIVVSQPIKGTRKRVSDPHQDSLIRTELMTSEKDRAENVMITDLVRNDLSRCCMPGTVEVDELCGIHSFSHVHQMISTVRGRLTPGTDFEKILQASFPMGSMTGAPKISVMEHIEKYENFRRGWYSGSVGYVNGDHFDLNVVIRSIQYDEEKPALVYHTGGAITYDSQASAEFEECMIKAAGIRDALRPGMLHT